MGMFIACLLGGWFGLHKFLEKKTGLGFLYLFTLGLCGIGWAIDTIRYLIKWLNGNKQIAPVNNTVSGHIVTPVVTPLNTPIVSNIQPVNDNNVYLSFKVAGVTFKNGRKTRQAILRAFKWGDEPIISVDFEPYEYEGRPAVYVKINDQVVGNVPADTTETFLDYERKYKRVTTDCNVYGGSRLDDGTRTNYGCEVYIKYLKDA